MTGPTPNSPVRLVPTGAIDMERVFDGVDSTDNRLVVLDPRRWALLNGKDALTRDEITGLLGLGPVTMRVDNAASCVVACVNAQRRDVARKRASEALAWRHVIRQINPDEIDELQEANAKLEEATAKLNKDVGKAFQHYVYLVRAGELIPEFKRFDDDTKSSLRASTCGLPSGFSSSLVRLTPVSLALAPAA